MTTYLTDLQPLRDRLELWGIQHFTAEELTLLKNPRWKGPRHVCPPPDKLNHIYGTIRLLDRVRELWGSPILVVSGYRPDAYNKLIGGASRSQHKEFRAIDSKPKNGDIVGYTRLVEHCIETADLFVSAIGFGKYDTFVHTDIGAEYQSLPRGRRARWDKRSSARA